MAAMVWHVSSVPPLAGIMLLPVRRKVREQVGRDTGILTMQHDEFTIGGTFWWSNQQWRCTDIGTRTIIAIRIDTVDVGSTKPELRRMIGHAEALADGWFNGPPYAVAENVFDEHDITGCSIEPDMGKMPPAR
jgi:hypothetical protein